MKQALTLDSVSVVRQERTLLAGISLQVPQGSFSAIVGPNGSGKTTLLKSVLGLADPYEGSIALMGQDILTMSARERAGSAGWLPQKDFTSEPMPVLDFVLTSRFRFRESRAAGIVAAMHALKEVGMEEFSGRRVSSLSGGESQRVSVACLLAQDTPILLVDEPGNHLDPGQQMLIYRLLGEQWRRGKTILCVTHDVNLLGHVGPIDTHREIEVLGLGGGHLQFETKYSEPQLGEHLSGLFGVDFCPQQTEDGVFFRVRGGRR